MAPALCGTKHYHVRSMVLLCEPEMEAAVSPTQPKPTLQAYHHSGAVHRVGDVTRAHLGLQLTHAPRPQGPHQPAVLSVLLMWQLLTFIREHKETIRLLPLSTFAHMAPTIRDILGPAVTP